MVSETWWEDPHTKYGSEGVHFVEKEQIFRRTVMILPHITRETAEQRCIELWVRSWERQKYKRKEVFIDVGHLIDLPARWKEGIPDPDCRSGKEASCTGVVPWMSLTCLHIITWCPLLLQEKGAVTPQETEPDLPVSIRESPAEAWVISDLPRGQGHWIQQCRQKAFWRRLPLLPLPLP